MDVVDIVVEAVERVFMGSFRDTRDRVNLS